MWLEFLTFATIPATAALIWWSFLPDAGGGSRIAETFDQAICTLAPDMIKAG